ncbi:spore coat protein GerQ [Paenibacillus sp. YYML68]|uniref:spore coat protein GerQ n=1 Tax=Paenibacillus sp. YYML68 TaxID=2909250 RepID=UPI002490B682|nr:spore coat protein GerQ [Paenibacillus sp. YYML68]
MYNPYKANPYGGQQPGYIGAQPVVQQTAPAGAQGYVPPVPSGTPITPQGVPIVPQAPAMPGTPGLLPMEQSYIENILRLNLGKLATIYMTYENNSEWNAKVYKGRIEAAGRDHIIISDPQTGMRYLLLMVNLDYITFDEELQYTYPYATAPTAR